MGREEILHSQQGAEGSVRLYRSKKERIDVEKTAVFFDGHDVQYVGMGQKHFESYDFVRKLHERANNVVGFNLTKMMFEGPKNELMRTINAQPAIVLANLANLMVLMYEKPEYFSSSPDFVTGQSLGFLNACHLAGVFRSKDGSDDGFEALIKYARNRGRIFQEVGDSGPKTGLLFLGIPPNKDNSVISREKVDEFTKARMVLTEGFSLSPAIVSNDTQIVFGGTLEQIVYAQETYLKGLKEKGFFNKLLEGSSAGFHTGAMHRAIKPLKEYLDKELAIRDALIPVITNSERPARLIRKAKDVKKEHLALVAQPVYADAIYDFLARQGVERIYEPGDKGVASHALIKDKRFLAGAAGSIVVAGAITAFLIRKNRKRP